MLILPATFRSLDDLLKATYTSILNDGSIVQSKRGENLEIINYAATLLNPRVRTSMSLDRKLVKSKFAEFAWYLSRKDNKEYIMPYIDAYEYEEQENNKILGAYGSKIFLSRGGEKSQYERVIEQISKRENTKQAYIVISEVENYKYRDGKYKSPPCTIGLHFYVRENRLNLTAYMRSNDAYFGLPHDLFCFTMLQELVAHRLGIELGAYTHVSTSMHIYNEHIDRIKNQYLEEGSQEPIEMPKIVDSSNETLELISNEFDPNITESVYEYLDSYWRDYVLFSDKFLNKNVEVETWKDMFNSKEMQRIALNSMVK